MAIGLLGKKLGMTQIIKPDGGFVPVTCLETGPCVVLGIKDKSIIVGFEDVKEKKVKKPQLGFFKKINVSPKNVIKEIPKDSEEYKVGQEIKVDVFQEGDFVDIKGVSIGKGFQGGVKRFHWKGGPRSHGSMSHRRVGSLGASAYPSRVMKGHPLPGHMGARLVTVQNLKVVQVDKENNLLLVKGAVPGSENNILMIRMSKKKKIQPRVKQEEKPIIAEKPKAEDKPHAKETKPKEDKAKK